MLKVLQLLQKVLVKFGGVFLYINIYIFKKARE